MSFTFGTPKTVSSFTLPTTTASTGGFQFSAAGDAKSTKPAASITFTPTLTAVSSTANTSTAALNLTSTSVPGGFSFSGPATTSAGFSLPSTSTPAGFSVPSTSAPAGFGVPSTSTPAGFGLPGTSASTAFNIASTATTASAAPQFNLGSLGSATTSSNLASTVPGSTSLSFSLSTTTAPLLSSAATPSASSTTTAVTSSVFSLTGTTLPKQTTTTSTALTTTTSTSVSAPATATSTTSSTPIAGTITCAQIEEFVNKWTISLEEERKHFANQAKQMNAWDRLLMTNGEKIVTISSGMERIKQLQDQLDQELDFVTAQQKELVDLIVPLEKELADIPITDMDRHRTYQMAETLDTELKQMSEDLKEIIEHLNESNKHQELANPMYQIGSILNVHMNSLQWIDRQVTKISTHLDQISKMHDLNKRHHEINLQKTYV